MNAINFDVGDRVILIGAGTKNLLLEIVDHMYTLDMHRVKILATGQFGPVLKNDIRHATPDEEMAGHRIDVQPKERPISRKRARKLRKRRGVSVYFSKRLECLVWVKFA